MTNLVYLTSSNKFKTEKIEKVSKKEKKNIHEAKEISDDLNLLLTHQGCRGRKLRH